MRLIKHKEMTLDGNFEYPELPIFCYGVLV